MTHRGLNRVKERSVFLCVALVLVSTASLSGCAADRVDVGTASALCYSAIPVAKEALGKPAPVVVPSSASTTTTSGGGSSSSSTASTATTQGTTTRTSTAGSSTTTLPTRPGPQPVFVGVINASQKQIDAFGKTHNYKKNVLATRNGGPVHNVCLVAFKGSFDPALVKYVTGPVPPPGRRLFAMVVVSQPHDKVLATFIRTKEPIRFTHYTVGGG
ncbi:MAG: hypothetical protein WAM97_00425 [Acidimicrobiales bacterium]